MTNLTNNSFVMTILRQLAPRKLLNRKENGIYIGGGGYPKAEFKRSLRR
jgi:hypothetical protein